MSAKQQAILDIKEELVRQSKSFLAFRRELNPIMRKLVHEQIKKQKEVSHENK